MANTNSNYNSNTKNLWVIECNQAENITPCKRRDRKCRVVCAVSLCWYS